MVDYLREISERWDEIDEKSRTELLDKLFGKRGASVGSAIIGNFNAVEQALIEMENAAGAADAEMEVIQDSIDYKLNALKQTWVSVAQEMLQRDDIGDVVESLIIASEKLGDTLVNLSPFIKVIADIFEQFAGVTNVINGFTAAFVGLAALKIKKPEFLESIKKFFTEAPEQINNTENALKNETITINENIVATKNKTAADEDEFLQNWLNIGGTEENTVVTQQNTNANNQDAKSERDLGQSKAEESVKENQNTNDKRQNTKATLDNAKANWQNMSIKNKISTGAGIASAIGMTGSTIASSTDNEFAQDITSGLTSTAMLTMMGAQFGGVWGAAIAGVIGGISAIITGINNAERRTKEAAETARRQIKDINRELDNNVAYVDNIKDRYAELAQGVENLGKVNQSKGSLSTDEYNEFLDISEKLVDAFPQLYGGMDSTGESMTNLSGDVETITSSLEDLLEVERQLANQKIADELPQILKDDRETINDDIGYIEERNDRIAELNELMGQIESKTLGLGNIEYTAGQAKQIEDAIDALGLDLYSPVFNRRYGDESYYLLQWNFEQLTQEQQHEIEVYFSNLLRTYDREISESKREINSLNRELQRNLYSYAYANGYEGNIYNELISNLSYSDFTDDNGKVISDENILESFNELLYDLQNALKDEDFSENIEILLSGDADYRSFEQSYYEIYDYLVNTLGLDPETNDLLIHIKTIYDSEKNNISDVVNHLFSQASVSQVNAYTGEYFDKIAGLSDEYRNKLLDLYIPPHTLYTWDELMDKIHQTNDVVNDLAEAPATISKSIEEMAKQIEPQLSELGSIFSSLFQYDDAGKNITGIDWTTLDMSALEGIRSSFEDLEEELGFTFDKEKVDEFIASLADGNATVDSVREAFDDLATEYFYTTNVLNDLNESTAETIALALENQGVINAYDVTNYNLAAQALEELAVKENELLELQKQYVEADESNKSAISQNIKTTEQYINSIIEEINAYVAEIGATEETAEALYVLQMRKFILQNNGINTEEDCQQLINLANQAGYAGVYLENLIKLQGMLANQERLTNLAKLGKGSWEAVTRVSDAVDDFRASMQSELDNYTFKLDFEVPKSGSSSAGDAGKDAAEEYNEAFENELKVLEYLRNNDFIDEKEYLDQSNLGCFI